MKKQPHHFGIDLLRITATLMIVMTHVLAQGGVRRAVADSFDAYYVLTWLLQIAIYGAVNCYALISGYVGRKSPFRYSKLVDIWLQVAFYTVGITLCFALLGKSLGWKDWVVAFSPIINSQYWYVTAYVGLLWLMPLLNSLLKQVSARDLGVMLAGVFLFYCLLPALFNNTIEGLALNAGYSTLWIALLYLLGAYLSMVRLDKLPKNRYLLLLFLLLIPLNFWAKETLGVIWFRYSSPTMLLSALLLFILFARLKITQPTTQKLISYLAPTTFGVYLIHLHPLVVKFLLRNFAQTMVDEPLYLFPIMVLVASILIFILSSLVEGLRIRLFKRLGVRRIGKRLDNYLYLKK